MRLKEVRTAIRKIIQEEVHKHTLEETLIDFVFGVASNVASALIDKHRDFLLRNLKDDPEIKAMQRDVGASRDAMVATFTRRYKTNKGFKSKVDSLIKKIK